jgi:hypothetical protein
LSSWWCDIEEDSWLADYPRTPSLLRLQRPFWSSHLFETLQSLANEHSGMTAHEGNGNGLFKDMCNQLRCSEQPNTPQGQPPI